MTTATLPRTLTRIRRATLAALFRQVAILVCGLTTAASAQEHPAPIRVGIVGLDAHALAWAQIIQKPDASPPISEMRIVAAVPAVSADIPSSVERTPATATKLREMGIEIIESVEAMLPKVDAVMILSVDGRTHPQQAAPIFAAKKPLFIDKPVAASLAEAAALFRRARETGTPFFSSSALRYGPATVAATNDPKLGRVLGCDAFSNSKSILPAHPDLFYYGIHGCETLFAVMGPGCETVSRVRTPTADLAIGVWKDGRLGTFRGILQGQVGFGATVFGEKAIASAGKFEGYEPLLAHIVAFFKTGQPPVSAEQTLEIYAFMEAADESLRRGGQPVALREVLDRARP